ncbi:BQ5605_C025g10047 [Microbotryum silenes-dioicae]|uniref:BQ5605_C025g10047 protein n=1 Tax=Microbotryum silenes-dioicae TaxID=796604 RepID=A0A2X0PFX4_9BASI|nr:BQ5605_C025g10047 [Microbotryum silenes-dioicae]
MPLSARRNVRSAPAPLKVPAILPSNLAPATPPDSGNSLLSRSSASTTNYSRRSSSDRDMPTPSTSAGSSSYVFPSPVRSTSSRGVSTSKAGLPPLPRKSSFNNVYETSGEEINTRKKMMMPRSAVVNQRCLDLDFGFLDEEPPVRSYSERRRSSLSSAGSAPTYERNRSSGVDYFQSLKRRESYTSNGPTEISAYASPPQATDRPDLSRRNDLPSHGPFRASRAFRLESTDPSVEAHSNSDADISPTQNLSVGSTGVHDGLDDGEATDQRKRLATFLDQAASAMEGGRSLRQVLPETAPARAGQAPAKSLSQLAESSASPPMPNGFSPATPQSLNPFPAIVPSQELSHAGFNTSTPVPPRISRVSGADIDHSSANAKRTTVFYTPDMVDNVPLPLSPLELEDGRPELRYVQDPSGTGLGLHTLAEQYGNSPTLLLVPSPSATEPPVIQNGARLSGVTLESNPQSDIDSSSEVRDRDDARAKMAEKRRRTIQELIETEQSYAIDMMVVRDIYLARARGLDLNSIADHVMASGLGLSASASPSSPPVKCEFDSLTFSSSSEARRLTMSSLNLNSAAGTIPKAGRRVSSAPSLSAKLVQRRATKARLSSSAGLAAPGIPVMSTKDLHVIFANLEEVADLAERFAHLLSKAKGATAVDGAEMDDNIGEVFVNLIPQIQKVYATYCARHHRAIVRLQELEPTLRTYLSECKTLSHGRTKAWDLASLLIKPVQRCLKYPLLLDQILAVTPESHPDRHDLVRANSKMLLVAESINQTKIREEVPSPALRRESKSSLSSSMTKKFLRSSSKTSTAQISTERAAERDDMFDTLAALVDSTRSSVLRLSSEMREWSKGTKAELETQVIVVEGWIDLYASLSEEPDAQDSLYHRLMVFLEEVLDPVIDGPYREVAHEVRHSLLLKSDHLLSLLESPRQFIQKRNDKMLAHSRYIAKKLPADRRGSDEFLELSARLLEELPRFLASVSKYYDIILGHFSGAQEAYKEKVQELWDFFAERFRLRDEQGMMGSQQVLANELMHRLAVGLGVSAPLLVPAPGSTSGEIGKRHLRHATNGSRNSMSSTGSTSIRRQSIIASGVPRPASTVSISNSGGGANNIHSRLQEYQFSARSQNEAPLIVNRNSITSDASTPSFTVSSKSGESSNNGPATPPVEEHQLKQGQHMQQRSSKQPFPSGVALPLARATSRKIERGIAPIPSSAPDESLHSPLQGPSFRGRSGSGDDASTGSSITATRPPGSPQCSGALDEESSSTSSNPSPTQGACCCRSVSSYVASIDDLL